MTGTLDDLDLGAGTHASDPEPPLASTDQAEGPSSPRRGSQSSPRRLSLAFARLLGRPRRSKNLRGPLGLGFLTCGCCTLLFLGYLFFFTSLQEARYQRQLLNVFTTPAGAVPLSGRIPPEGQPAGVLEIPTIHLKDVVVQGTSAVDLLKGPGIMPNTARVGTVGNAVIAGRSATGGAPFARLKDLSRGKLIWVITGLGDFRYSVRRVGIAHPGQRSPASPSHRAQLTLISSNSLAASGLLYVVARLVSAPASAPQPRHPPTATELGLAGDPAAWMPALVWALVLAGCLTVSFVAYRRAGKRVVTVYLLSTPIILAVVFQCYHYVYLLLPSTL